MTANIDAVWEKLKSVDGEIGREAYRSYRSHGESGWGGAGVVFQKNKPPKPDSKGFYPDPRYVVTPFDDEAAWLLYKLRDIFHDAGLIDYCSKIEFFGRLANAALRFQNKAKKQETASGLLLAMLREAELMLSEMEKGKFQCLMVAPGGVIADDLREHERE